MRSRIDSCIVGSSIACEATQRTSSLTDTERRALQQLADADGILILVGGRLTPASRRETIGPSIPQSTMMPEMCVWVAVRLQVWAKPGRA